MNRDRRLLICVVGLTVSAAALILIVPSAIESDAAPWFVGLLAALVAVFGAGTLRWRPARRDLR